MPTRTITHANTRPDTVRPPPAAGRRRGDGGQAAALAVIALTTLAVVLIMAVAQLGTSVLERSAAQTAADAAALAGVIGDRPAADRVARANGAAIIAWRAGPHEVTVTVRLGDAVATARATDAP
jgi:hypothetical protein